MRLGGKPSPLLIETGRPCAQSPERQASATFASSRSHKGNTFAERRLSQSGTRCRLGSSPQGPMGARLADLLRERPGFHGIARELPLAFFDSLFVPLVVRPKIIRDHQAGLIG